jgi:hypothetical protein
VKTIEETDLIMQTIPEAWRDRWCGGERGPCACAGCVQIGNRSLMALHTNGRLYRGDLERIDESKIPAPIYNKYKITHEEYDLWKAAQS